MRTIAQTFKQNFRDFKKVVCAHGYLRVDGEGVTMLRNRNDFSMSHSAY